MPAPINAPALALLAPALALLLAPVAASPQNAEGLPFPEVRGRNLLKETFTLPGDLPGEERILLIPFHQWQQREVDTWLKRLPALAEGHPGLRYYEVPTLGTGWKLMRWMIDGGMRSGIPDPAARARTITVYTDRTAFMERAGIPDDDHITIVLLDVAGRIVWRARGPLNEESWSGLQRVLGQGSGTEDGGDI
jgi:hypothetical protein